MIPATVPRAIQPWPPVITGSRLRRWMVFRDVVLTILAWILLGWLLRDVIFLIYDFLRHPIFELTTAQPPDLHMLWGRLQYFIILSASLVAALSLWAFVNRDRLAAATKYDQPSPLTIAEQSWRFGVAESAVEEARDFKIANVNFREDGTVEGFERKVIVQTSAAQKA